MGATERSLPVGTPESVVWAMVRHLLTILGGYLASQGLIEGEVEAFVGVAIAALGIIWSILNKRLVSRYITTALSAKAGTPRSTLDALVKNGET